MDPRRASLVLVAATLALAACGGKKGTSSTSSSTTGGHGHGGGDGGTGTGGSGGHGGSVPSCGTDAWTTYGHDARRTSASDGCVKGALSTTWRYAPAPPPGKSLNDVFNAVGESDGVFLAWSASNGMYLGTSAADRVDTTGPRSYGEGSPMPVGGRGARGMLSGV